MKLEPGQVLLQEESAVLWLVTVASEKFPGSFNAYPIRFDSVKWEVYGERKEFTSTDAFKPASNPPRASEIVAMLNAALYRKELDVNALRERAATAEQRVEDINDALIREARERDWCDEFEKFAEELGLRGCKRDFNVTFDVSYRITTTITAASEDEAEEMVSGWDLNIGDQLNEAVEYAVSSDSPDVSDIYVEEVC